jgi:MoaA/NifB/PqqE/SkfB family radical SAM enzyme
MDDDLKQGTYQGRCDKSLGIEVTTRCNKSCRHCFARAAISKPSSLPLTLAKEIIKEGYQLGYRQLHITGGEPLLWPGLCEALDCAFDEGYETVLMNTNGTLITGAIASCLAAYDSLTISVSLDGPEVLHDDIRGKGSYRKAVGGIEKASEADIDLLIFTTVNKSLVPYLPCFADETYNKFPSIKYLTLIQLIRVTDDFFDLSKELLDPDDFLHWVYTVSLLNLYGLETHVLNNPLACVASKLLELPWVPHSHPLYGEGSVFIMANRDITLSHSNRSSFGKYEPGVLEKVLDSDVYRDAIASHNVNCAACRYQKVCLENDMRQPSEGFRSMYRGVPYCKQVLDRAAQRCAG